MYFLNHQLYKVAGHQSMLPRGHSRILIKGVQNTYDAGLIVGNDDNSH